MITYTCNFCGKEIEGKPVRIIVVSEHQQIAANLNTVLSSLTVFHFHVACTNEFYTFSKPLKITGVAVPIDSADMGYPNTLASMLFRANERFK